MKMTFIILGSIVIFLGGATIACGVAMIREGAKRDDPLLWTVVCDSRGHYSYIGFDGVVAEPFYDSREEAEVGAFKGRQWHLDYVSGKFAERYAKEAAAKREQAKAFKPCPP